MDNGKLPLFGEYVLDLTRGSLLRGMQPVHLRPQAYRALKLLAQNRGRLISKDELIDEVWEGRAVTDDSLVQCLRDVRHALGSSGNQYLRNERGRGYIFDPEGSVALQVTEEPGWTEEFDLVRVVVDEEEELPVPEPPLGSSRLTSRAAVRQPALLPSDDTRQAPSKRRLLVLISATLALAAAITFIYLKYFGERTRTINSIAVLPFINEGGNTEMQYLSDGLCENLINSLSQLPGLKVISRSSSFEYKGKQISPQEAAKALNVEAILNGRVVQRGESLIVSVELMDARDNTQVWGEQYNRSAADIQAVQEEIARTVSEKLRLRLTGEQERQLTRRATESSQAYQFYLSGLFYERHNSLEAAKRAVDYFNQAVAIDPNFALAWAGLAKTHVGFAANSWSDPKEANAKAKASAETALRLDETLPEAHLVLAIIEQHAWDWAAAEHQYKRALELNPNFVDARISYSDYLSIMGRHQEALTVIKRAQEVDPLRITLRSREAFLMCLARRCNEGLELMLEIRKAAPEIGGTGLAFLYEATGKYQEAIEQHKSQINKNGETTGALCYLGWSLAAAGRKEEALTIVERLNTTRDYVSSAELAALHAMLGDKDRAFALLEKAYAAHDLQLQYLKIAWQYDSLRSDPRYSDLMRRVGLPI